MTDTPLVVEATHTADACVIWLHGLGADGHDFSPVIAHLGRNLTSHVRFVFPHAPYRPVTINGGYVMRAWYDIVDADLERRADATGIRESAALVETMVSEQVAAGIAASRIVLAGFSQGGAVVLQAGLRMPRAMAGIIALSTYLPLPEETTTQASAAGRTLPVLMAHGSDDPIIPLAASERSRDTLAALGCRVSFHVYDMPHSVCEQEIADIAAWLARELPPR